MTLTEVLVTLVISMALSLATFSLVDVTIRRRGEISARADGVQRGRLAMDLMTRQLRSQVCLGASAPVSRSIVAGSANSVTFYAELGDPSTLGAGASPSATPRPRIVEKRSLTLETTGSYAPGTLVERRYVGVPTPSQRALGYVFPDAPTSTRELMRPMALAKTPDQPTATPALFRFYACDTSNAADPKPTLLLPFATANALSDADVKKVARIKITFRAKPPKPAKPRPSSSTRCSCAPSIPMPKRES